MPAISQSRVVTTGLRHQRSTSSETTSTSSWSTEAYTTADSHGKAEFPLGRPGSDDRATGHIEAPLPFSGGAVFNPIRSNTARSGYRSTFASGNNLEAFRLPRGAILNPVWIAMPEVGLGNISGGRADLEPFRPSLANPSWLEYVGEQKQVTRVLWQSPPVPDREVSEDFVCTAALRSYDYLHIEKPTLNVEKLAQDMGPSEEAKALWREAEKMVGSAGEDPLLKKPRTDDAPSVLLAPAHEDASDERAESTLPTGIKTPSDVDPGLVGLRE
ncbi:uncharacterized protein B0H18DRAFT_1115732 [Fomitopsis serialis]|uniref:uncharacterized protein n=1 Tax=Fomitopsis serialis TaxID=139415 RepID=UPI00200730F0|nr:uncharacterized protein B0H18DRAFT_1115732 [Neoantrodia serialis]KAH9932473.1 hypothetical protein B0H18DRAFT_1115732 [Neoantrodia serialis]